MSAAIWIDGGIIHYTNYNQEPLELAFIGMGVYFSDAPIGTAFVVYINEKIIPYRSILRYGVNITEDNQNGSYTFTYDDFHVFNHTSWEIYIGFYGGGGFSVLYAPNQGLISAPVAEFSGTPRAIQAPGYVQFTDLSTQYPKSWLWDFGDDSTQSVQQNPQHHYVKIGSFTVSLTASNYGGSSTMTKLNYIVATLLPPFGAPVVEFVGTPLSGTTPLTVQFTDQSTYVPTSWFWHFGDNTTSTEQHPSHIYAVPGRYTVSLQAVNEYGSGVLTKKYYIRVSSGGGLVVGGKAVILGDTLGKQFAAPAAVPVVGQKAGSISDAALVSSETPVVGQKMGLVTAGSGKQFLIDL